MPNRYLAFVFTYNHFHYLLIHTKCLFLLFTTDKGFQNLLLWFNWNCLLPNSSLKCCQFFCDTCKTSRNNLNHKLFIFDRDFNPPNSKWCVDDSFIRNTDLYTPSAEILTVCSPSHFVPFILGRTLNLYPIHHGLGKNVFNNIYLTC